MSALERFCRAADETLAVSGSDDLAKEFVQAGNTDFQSLFYYLIVIFRKVYNGRLCRRR